MNRSQAMKCEECGRGTVADVGTYNIAQRNIVVQCLICNGRWTYSEISFYEKYKDVEHFVVMVDLVETPAVVLTMLNDDSKQETPEPPAEEPTQETWRDRKPLL
jgi:hypothetical protein